MLITQHCKYMKIFPNSDKHSWVLNAKVLHIFSFMQDLNVDARFCDGISMFLQIPLSCGSFFIGGDGRKEWRWPEL